MTVERINVYSGPFLGNGVTKTFPFDFQAASSVEVIATIDGAAVDPSDFTVSVEDDGTGSITFFLAPGGTVMIYSDPLFTQEVDFQDQGPFYQSAVNEPIDRGALRDLWLRDRVDRSFQVPIGGGVDGMFPVVLPGGIPGFSLGTGADLALRGDLAVPANGVIAWLQSGLGAVGRWLRDKVRESVSVTDYGAIGDGTDHPLSERFATLAAAKAVYPFVYKLSQTQDWAAFQAAINAASQGAGGGHIKVPKGTYIIGNRITPRSGVTLFGVNRRACILKAQNGSVDSVIGIDYMVDGEVAARANGATMASNLAPDFVTMLTPLERQTTGGFAGYATVDWHVRDLTLDGNKDNCPENSNFIGASGGLTGNFYSGDTVTSSSGGTAIVGAVFPNGSSPPGIALRPDTVVGTFNVGNTVTGSAGGTLTITSKEADDAYQNLAIFNAATKCSLKRCILKNSVFQACTVYNQCNDIEISDNVFENNNKAGTTYTGGNVNLYSDFSNVNLRILRNTFYRGGGYGVAISESSGASYGPTIAFNRFYIPTGDAIRVSVDSASSTSTIFDPVIVGNYVEGGGDCGIRLYHNGAANGILRGVVANNRVRDTPYGILLSGRVFRSSVIGNAIANATSAEIDIGTNWITNGNIQVGNAGETTALVNKFAGAVAATAFRVGGVTTAQNSNEILTLNGGNGVFGRTQYTLGTVGVDIGRGAGLVVLCRDDINGESALVGYENGKTPTIIWQSGTSYTVSAPTGSQVAFANRSGGNGVAAYMASGQSTTLNALCICVDNA